MVGFTACTSVASLKRGNMNHRVMSKSYIVFGYVDRWYKGTEYRKKSSNKAGQTSRDSQRTNKNTTSVH